MQDINTQLINAIKANDYWQVHNCIQNGASVNHIDETNKKPFQYTMENIEGRINRKGTWSKEKEYDYFQTKYEICEMLWLNGYNINEKIDNHGLTLLYKSYDSPDKMEYLIKNGAETFIKDNYNRTPLNFIAETTEPDLEIFQILIKYEANINTQQNNGCTPLHWTVKQNLPHHAKELIKAGADLTIKDNAGLNPTQWINQFGENLDTILDKANF